MSNQLVSKVDTGSKWAGAKALMLVFLLAVSGALVKLIWWSFLQTEQWFNFLQTSDAQNIALAMAILFQFGQGPILYFRSLAASRERDLKEQLTTERNSMKIRELQSELLTARFAVWGLILVWAIFAVVDWRSNYVEMNKTITANGENYADKQLFIQIAAPALVFFEEVLGIFISLATHLLNDLLQIAGWKRIGWLDAISHNSLRTAGIAAPSRNNGSFNNRETPAAQSTPVKAPAYRSPNNFAGNGPFPATEKKAPPPAGSSRPIYAEPTYHPAGMGTRQEVPNGTQEESARGVQGDELSESLQAALREASERRNKA